LKRPKPPPKPPLPSRGTVPHRATSPPSPGGTRRRTAPRRAKERIRFLNAGKCNVWEGFTNVACSGLRTSLRRAMKEDTRGREICNQFCAYRSCFMRSYDDR
jgi:hypothetical protein